MSDLDTDLYESDDHYTSGCKHCGDDRRPRRGDVCIDCTDPGDWYPNWEER